MPPLKEDSDHDILAAMVKWVEDDVPPTTIIGTAYNNNDAADGVAFTRPLCKVCALRSFTSTLQLNYDPSILLPLCTSAGTLRKLAVSSVHDAKRFAEFVLARRLLLQKLMFPVYSSYLPFSNRSVLCEEVVSHLNQTYNAVSNINDHF